MSLENTKKTLYELIGPVFIENAVAEFYRRAFIDPMIGHFFFHSNIEHITRQQISFTYALLGGPQAYRGQPLKIAHKPFLIRPQHFSRRQVLMREVLTDLSLDKTLIDQWLAQEQQLRPVILTDELSCHR